MRLMATGVLALLLTVTGTAQAASSLDYRGSFSEARVTGEGCESLFMVEDYLATHALAGPTRRTSVMKFTDTEARRDGREPGFFDGLVLIGLLGGSNDLFYDKTVATDGLSYAVHAEGFIDWSVLYLEFEVKGKNAEGDVVCTGSATYSAFE